MLAPQNSPVQAGAALRCKGLVKRYDDVTAVAGIHMEVHTGECFGLLGPNGAGKTTTVEILEGLTPPSAGEVEVLGQQWGRGNDRKLRDRLGIQLQETQLGDKLTVEEVVRLFRSFYSRGREVDEVVDILGLEPKRRSQYSKLSGGQKQRVALACAIVGAPEVLFLDEPTTGLDPQARRHIWDVVERFRDGGGTVMLTTHYMEEASRLCDRVGIMDQGQIIRVGTPAELIEALGADEVIELQVEPDLDLTRLESMPGVLTATRRLQRIILTVDHIAAALPALLDAIDTQGVSLQGLTTHQATLEDVFIHLTGRALRDE